MLNKSNVLILLLLGLTVANIQAGGTPTWTVVKFVATPEVTRLDNDGFLECAKIGDIKKLRLALVYEELSNSKFYDIQNAFWLACKHGHHNIVMEFIKLKYVFEECAKQIIDSETLESSPFMQACQWGRTDVVRLILSLSGMCKKDLVNKLYQGDTAISVAAVNDHVGTVRLLLENGANPNLGRIHALDYAKYRTISIGRSEENRQIIAMLLKAGAKESPHAYIEEVHSPAAACAAKSDETLKDDCMEVDGSQETGACKRSAEEEAEDLRQKAEELTLDALKEASKKAESLEEAAARKERDRSKKRRMDK